MVNPKKEDSPSLTDKELEGVQGGLGIPVTGPALKPKVPGSIAQGDTISIDNNLPDAGGGVVV